MVVWLLYRGAGVKRHEREAVAIIREVLEPWGFETRTHHGGKHLAVVVTLRDGSEHKFAIAGSPQNVDHMLVNTRQEVMAWLDRQGLGSGRGKTGARKKRRRIRTKSTIWRYEVSLDTPTEGLSSDPWAVLATILEPSSHSDGPEGIVGA